MVAVCGLRGRWVIDVFNHVLVPSGGEVVDI